MSDGRIANMFLMVVTFCCAFYMAMEGAEADTAEPGYTAVTTLNDDDEYAGKYNSYFGHTPVLRQMNGTLWMFDNFVVTYAVEHTIYGHFSTDKGDTWNTIKIIDQDDPDFSVGGYPANIVDGCILSNNSIVILIEMYAYQTTNNLELWMFCHWNNTDLSQWERLPVYVSESYSLSSGWSQIVVGNDDTVYSYHKRAAHTMYWKSWDMATRVGTQIFSKYPAYTGYKFWFMIDSTEQLLFGAANGANPEYLYIYRIPEGTLYASRGGSSSYYWRDCIVTLDDTIVGIVSWGTGGQYDYLWYYNGTGEGFTQIMSASETLVYPKFGLCQGDPTRIYIFSYSQDTDHFVYKSQDYFAGSTPWAASFNEVWEDSESSTKSFGWAGSRDHFPQVYSDIEEEMVYTQLPDTGWIFPFSDYDVGADDWDHYIIHMNSTTWMGIPFYMGPAPNITTEALDSGTFGEWYMFVMGAEDGEVPYIWSLLVNPAWLSIGESNGTLYGDPGAVAVYPVTIRLTETHDAPRWDDEEFSLTISSAEGEPGEEEGDVGVGTGWAIPQSLMSDLWMLFIVTAMFVGVATALRKYLDRLQGWRFAQRRYSTYRKPIYSGYKKRRPPKPRSKYRYKY